MMLMLIQPFHYVQLFVILSYSNPKCTSCDADEIPNANKGKTTDPGQKKHNQPGNYYASHF